jgi:tetratricopeptide (TPR) repeat protein
LVPYLCWGVYCLRSTMGHERELGLLTEAATLVLLIPFFIFEFSEISAWLANDPIGFALAILSLFTSGGILYGPVVQHFLSHVLVDLVTPSEHFDIHEPRYGAAESLERQGDYAGAAGVYEAIARMFPNEPTPALRAADNFSRQGRFEEAAQWFHKGLERLKSPDECLTVVYRLAEIYERELQQPDRARVVLAEYLAAHPDAEHAEFVRQRLQSLAKTAAQPKPEPNDTREYLVL